MELFNFIQFKDREALIDGESGKGISYGNLTDAVNQFTGLLGNQKSFVFLFIKSTVDDLTAYLAMLQCGNAVAVFDGDLHPDLKFQLINLYKPHFIIESSSADRAAIEEDYLPLSAPFSSVSIWQRQRIEESPLIHPDLLLLLSTSGTTGSPKLIRLTRKNIISNASAICN